MKNLNLNTEHIERTILRPIIEHFCNTYMDKNGFDRYIIKMVEYIPILDKGRADLYFGLDKKYAHIVISIPITKIIDKTHVDYKIGDISIVSKDDTPPIKPVKFL